MEPHLRAHVCPAVARGIEERGAQVAELNVQHHEEHETGPVHHVPHAVFKIGEVVKCGKYRVSNIAQHAQSTTGSNGIYRTW